MALVAPERCCVRLRSLPLSIALVLPSLLIGCHRQPQAVAVDNTLHYSVRGVVESKDTANHEILLKHGAVAGLMPAMSMVYPVVDPAALQEMNPGDTIMATIDADRSPDGPTHLRLVDVDIIAEGKPDQVPTVQYHVPAPGDAVPDFTLVNHSDHTLDLRQFRGKVLLMTFIYTRCPLSDYCPRMSHNFAEIDKALAADPKAYADTHLLSVSFDPAYDTPKVLKSYGEAYTGQYTNATFQHWDFAAPPQRELAKVDQYFDVGVTPGQNGSLQHSLSTTIIGKDGKVIAFYPTNDWSVADVLAKVKAAAE
jgi:protein SCO1/2